MRIGNLEFAYPVFLAPMAGVTDTPYRILAREIRWCIQRWLATRELTIAMSIL